MLCCRVVQWLSCVCMLHWVVHFVSDISDRTQDTCLAICGVLNKYKQNGVQCFFQDHCHYFGYFQPHFQPRTCLLLWAPFCHLFSYLILSSTERPIHLLYQLAYTKLPNTVEYCYTARVIWPVYNVWQSFRLIISAI